MILLLEEIDLDVREAEGGKKGPGYVTTVKLKRLEEWPDELLDEAPDGFEVETLRFVRRVR